MSQRGGFDVVNFILTCIAAAAVGVLVVSTFNLLCRTFGWR